MIKTFVRLLTLTALSLLLMGCEKYGSNGRAIRFSATSHAEGSAGAGTKTAYGDPVSSGTQSIYWTSGDKIRIASDYAYVHESNPKVYYADYNVPPKTEDAQKATASSVNADGYLEWDEGQSTYHFSAIYPVPTGSVTFGVGSATGMTIPASQSLGAMTVVTPDSTHPEKTVTTFAADMTSAWMLADNTGVNKASASSSGFNLDFYPAFTAFEFTLASLVAATPKVKSFTLKSADGALGTDLVGTFSATINPGNASTYTVTSGTRAITVDFGAGEDISQDNSLQFTVLALPQEIKRLSVDFVININGADIHRTLALTNSDSSFPSELKDANGYIKFPACKKYRISGLLLPSGGLKMSVDVNDWIQATDNPYNYISPVSTSLRCVDAKYRSYTTGGKDYVVISYGYQNDSDEIIVTDDPEEFQIAQNTLLRPAYSPILELATNSDPSNVLQLQLDNPRFKFVQYGVDYSIPPSGGIDLSVRDYSKTDHLDIESGSAKKTFFSVVPVEQFSVDTPEADKICRVSLLSVSPGTLHEIPFNQTSDAATDPALPGENKNELKLMYFGPAVYGTTGTLKP